MKTNTITVHHVNDANKVEADIKLYCGRNGFKYPNLIDVKMGNPHFMNNEAMRDAVCKAYREDLEFDSSHPHWRKIKRMAQRLDEGKTVALFCHCSPKACHTEVIRDMVRLEVTV